MIYLVGKIDENYIIRNYGEGDDKNIVELLMQIWGKWPPARAVESISLQPMSWLNS